MSDGRMQKLEGRKGRRGLRVGRLVDGLSRSVGPDVTWWDRLQRLGLWGSLTGLNTWT